MYSKHLFKIALSVSLLTINMAAYAHDIKLYNSSLIDTTQQELYIGLENQIIVKGAAPQSYYQMVFHGSDTIPVINGIAIIYPPENLKAKTAILQLIDEHNTIIAQQNVALKNLDMPEILIGDNKKKKYSVENLIQSAQISLKPIVHNYKKFHADIFSYKLTVMDGDQTYLIKNITPKGATDTVPIIDPVTQEFTYAIQVKDNESVSEEFINNTLKNSVIDQLRALPKNAKLIIHDIQVKYPNERMINIADQTLTRY